MYIIKSFVERPQDKNWHGYVFEYELFQSLVSPRIYMTSGYECFHEGFFHMHCAFIKTPREDAGGLSREYVLRIPSVS